MANQNLTISIDISEGKNSDGEMEKQYTPTIVYHDGKKETAIPDFESIALKWSKSGRGKGLKAEVKLRAPVLRKGRLEATNKVFAIPSQLDDVISLAKFITKSVPTEETIQASTKSSKKPAIRVEDPDLNDAEVEDVAEAVV